MSRRRCVKRSFIGLAVVITLPVAGYFGWRAWLTNGYERDLRAAKAETDRIDPNWRWDDLIASREPVPEELNAEGPVRRVSGLLGRDVHPQRDPDHPESYGFASGGLPNQLLLDEDRAILARTLAPHGEALRLARALVNFRQARYPLPLPPNPASQLSDFALHTYRVYYFLQWDAERQCQEGRAAEAIQSIRGMFAVARFGANEPTVTDLLSSSARQALAAISLERLLGLFPTVEGLADLDPDLAAAVDTGGLRLALRGERARWSAVLDRVHDGTIELEPLIADVEWLQRSARSKGPGITERQPASVTAFQYRPYVQRDHIEFLRAMNRLIEEADRPLHEMRGVFRGAEEAAANSPYKLAAAWRTNLSSLHAGIQQNLAHTQCARAAVAVERYRTGHGRWPASLHEIDRSMLTSTPLDPYTGRPVRYRRTDYGVVIYSVGDNLTDDHGDVGVDSKTGNRRLDVGFRLWDPDRRRRPPPRPSWLSDEPADAVIGVNSGVLPHPRDRSLWLDGFGPQVEFP